MMQKVEDRIYLSHPLTEIRTKISASTKYGNFFVIDFYDFYFAVSASEYDSKSRKPKSFITPITRDMGPKIAASSKKGKPLVTELYYFILL